MMPRQPSGTIYMGSLGVEVVHVFVLLLFNVADFLGKLLNCVLVCAVLHLQIWGALSVS